MNRDWAWWDDTYDFIEDSNPEYVKATLSDESILGLRLNFIIYINSSGEIVVARGFDLNTNKELPIPETLKEWIKKKRQLRHI